nr:MAG TPA: hypothetical protein [Caudoviricetes sp.]
MINHNLFLSNRDATRHIGYYSDLLMYYGCVNDT